MGLPSEHHKVHKMIAPEQCGVDVSSLPQSWVRVKYISPDSETRCALHIHPNAVPQCGPEAGSRALLLASDSAPKLIIH